MNRSSAHCSGFASLNGPRQLNSSCCTFATAAARPRSGLRRVARRHAGVVEMLVGEQRAVVAGDALALADEQAQARCTSCGVSSRRPIASLAQRSPWRSGRSATRRRRRRLLVGGDGLAHVREHAIDVVAACSRAALPRPPAPPALPSGPASLGKPASAGSGPKTASYSVLVVRLQEPCIARSIAAVLDARPRAGRAPATRGCPCGRPRRTRRCARRRRPASCGACPTPTPRPTGSPSWNCLSGAWQLAHDTGRRG